jgi:hypothetical protein
VYIVADFSDYDCSQHPVQGFAVAKSRLEYMMRNKDDEKHIAYIVPKYRRHMRRHVKSTHGISYDVIGQQASGDNTTSDDNTAKTTGIVFQFTKMLIHDNLIEVSSPTLTPYELIEKHEIGVDITGDDVGLMVKPTTKFNNEIVEQMYTTAANNSGWSVKEGSFSINIMSDEPLEYLSHGVKDRHFKTIFDKVLVVRCLVRPHDRQWGKFFISPEISNFTTTQNKAKLTSKYMTLCMASIGNPLMMVASLNMMLILRSVATSHMTSYSWAGIQSTTLGTLMLNHCLELQIGCKLNQTFVKIKIYKEENDEFVALAKELNSDIMKLLRKDRRIKLSYKNTMLLDDNYYWNYNYTLMYIKEIYNELDRISHVSVSENENKWWNNYKVPDDNPPKEKHVSKTLVKLTCEHYNKDDLQELFVTDKEHNFKIKVLCDKCYATRKEKRYEAINVCWIANKNENKNQLTQSVKSNRGISD